MTKFKIKKVRPREPTVMGIDPSLTGTAICTLWHSIPTMTRFSTLATKTCHGRVMRYSKILSNVVAAVRQHQPKLVLIEGYSFMSKGRGIFDRCEAGGVIRRQLWCDCDVRIVEVPPTVLKKFITGKGNANKTEMVAAITARYKATYKTDDEYDSFGLAKLAEMMVGVKAPKNKIQTKIVADMTRVWRAEQAEE